ncbi:hypothetical protein JCM33374_g2532 [Metschnikowia sp. JCM 33374]|nr:hypothetical protein JCM33374_g2532 [Metschnikowia sp. JCM 33374]
MFLQHTNIAIASQNSHYSDARVASGTPMDPQTLSSSMLSSSPDQPHKKPSVSNLTKNLMSSSSTPSSSSKYTVGPPAAQTATPDPSFSRQPPSYSASVTPHNKFIPVGSFGSQHSHSNLASSPFHHGNHFTNANPSIPSFTPPTGNLNYLPLGHNTPTVVSSSYTSSHSFTPSYQAGNVYSNDSIHHSQYQPQTQPQPQSASVLSGSYKIPGGPTTNISMDSANPHLSIHNRNSFHGNSFSSTSSNFGKISNGNYVQSLPNSFAEASSLTGHSSQQTLQRIPSDRSVQQQQSSLSRNEDQSTQAQSVETGGSKPFNESTGSFLAGPDHYMSYAEYLQTLNNRDAENRTGDESGYEEHLNIVEYPVDELITMLACLLTKIIEANDKLHPNHFDNTIAVRQKLKEHKKIKKLEKERRANQPRESTSFTRDGINTTVSHVAEDDNSDESSDDEEDELKNKYLANVLAFHGTNVPGITLHAYLTRVLKYCPVTNEVFLSLLVYFDRIAKRANNFQNKKPSTGEESQGDSEQIFVMDSFNIHRLIISGITVSSKFFSDIFYKNLRYAKVGGLPLEELNYLELQFLLLLDFKLMISVEDLQNYGDLLLKFWKREQLASEIVNTHGSENSSQNQSS